MEDIWYHGSPIEFKEFKFGKKTNSRLPSPDSLHFTKSLDLAKKYAKEIMIYEVKIKHDETNRYYDFQIISDYDIIGLVDGPKCVEVFNLDNIIIQNIVQR